MPRALRLKSAQVRTRDVRRSEDARSKPGESFDFGLGARQNLGPLTADMQRRETDQAGEEHREGARHGVAQPTFGRAEPRIHGTHRPGSGKTRIRTRGEGSGIRLRHGRTSPWELRSVRGVPPPESQ